jgi:peroxiredoxin
MLQAGQQAPHFHRRPVFGLELDLGELTSQRPLALVFVGSLGSEQGTGILMSLQSMCADFEREGVGLLAVSSSGLLLARDFVPRYHLLFPLIADPDGDLAKAYQVGDAGIGHKLEGWSPAGLRSRLRLFQQGLGWQLDPRADRPAAFLVSPGGSLAQVQYRSETGSLDIGRLLSEAG